MIVKAMFCPENSTSQHSSSPVALKHPFPFSSAVFSSFGHGEWDTDIPFNAQCSWSLILSIQTVMTLFFSHCLLQKVASLTKAKSSTDVQMETLRRQFGNMKNLAKTTKVGSSLGTMTSPPWLFDQVYNIRHQLPPVEQASDSIRKWLVTSLTIMPLLYEIDMVASRVWCQVESLLPFLLQRPEQHCLVLETRRSKNSKHS